MELIRASLNCGRCPRYVLHFSLLSDERLKDTDGGGDLASAVAQAGKDDQDNDSD